MTPCRDAQKVLVGFDPHPPHCSGSKVSGLQPGPTTPSTKEEIESYYHRCRNQGSCAPQDFAINKEVIFPCVENAPFLQGKSALRHVPKFEMLPTSLHIAKLKA